MPIWFGGQNSRLFQIASHVSPTLRLSLIFHEVKARIGTTLPVVIGAPIPFASLAAIQDRQALADHLRARVYALASAAPAIGGPAPRGRQSGACARAAREPGGVTGGPAQAAVEATSIGPGPSSVTNRVVLAAQPRPR